MLTEASRDQISRLSLPRAKVDAFGAEVGGAGFLRCAAKNFGPPRDLEASEASGFYKGLKLCFQQSAGDSTGPQLNVFFSFLGHGSVHQNVTYLQASPRFEDSMHFRQGGPLVWNQIEDSVGDDQICPLIGHR